MKTLIIQNQFFLVPELQHEFSRLIFSPHSHSEGHRQFFERRFHELQKAAPAVEWKSGAKSEEADLILAWDAFEEKKRFGSRIHGHQNRLFSGAEASTLPFPVPEGFTPFREKAERYLPPLFPDARLPVDTEVTQVLKSYFWEKRLASTYFETRNQLTGPDFSTKFSPYLSCGALDVKHLYNEVKRFEEAFGANKSTTWIIYELLWREYFYWHYQKHQSAYFSENGLKGPKDFSPVKAYSPTELRELKAHPFFHAALRELTSTGFLSNRARQMFASVWLNDLGLNWRSGARLFQEHLIDYDVYSNFGNWMYLAGVGVDPRGRRYFDIDKQLRTYDPNGDYLRNDNFPDFTSP
jgi:deoxyribodipyrimidine photo-lyase